MSLPRVLVFVLAGGAGGRLELLTENRAKPAVPFAGVYRLIDFPLSSCQHSHLPDVWVAVQFHPASLSQHLANGRPWDLDRTTGGLMTLPPHLGTEREGWATGTADVLWRNAQLIRDYRADALLVLSADAVYRLDYREIVDAHLAHGREVTMVTTQVEADDASRYGVVQVDGDVVTRYDYKPDEPEGTTICNEVLVFDPVRTFDRLEQLSRDAGDDDLEDLGDDLLPQQARDGEARAYAFDGYWRDVGTVEAYWQAHQDFLRPDPPIELDDPSWPVHTRGGPRSAARLMPGADVQESLVSGGSRVEGTVHGSVLSPGVVVEAGATVVDSVLLPGVRVEAGAWVTRAVLDDDVVVGRGARVGGDGDIALVGRAAHVAPGSTVEAGGRHPDPDDD